MSSAKPTPRYVQRIPAPNIHLVGATAEAQVIPIRRVTPAYVPTIEAPAHPAPVRRRATRFVPVEQRPWRVMLVPPTPGARTRTFGVARWQAQFVVAALAVTLLLAGGAVVALVGAVESPDLFGSSETEQLRDRLEQLQDSLTLARAELATDDEVVGDSLFDVLPGAAIPMPADAGGAKTAASRLAARKPSLSRGARTEGGIEMAPRSLEGLPVIGRLASGFSRSRRHPVLHIRRPHLGVDVAAPRGTHITAPAAGTVSFVGRKFGFGLVVEMEHGSGVRTRYAHLTASMVHVGDQVAKGTFIATVGSSGITTGPHLHYEVLVRGRQVDPLRYRLPQPAEAQVMESGAGSAGSAAPEAGSTVVPGAGSPEAPDARLRESGAGETIAPVQAAPAPR
ncbi:MAG TPA: M23 family metallopeptidase [Gemmatimonadaceae bacterium]|nr:M23 family metallopeptidase [Gemmatimonadaceae bacterium]